MIVFGMRKTNKINIIVFLLFDLVYNLGFFLF